MRTVGRINQRIGMRNGKQDTMLKIKKQFVVNEQNQAVGVILDLATFQEIEELLEDHLLSKSIEEVSKEKALPIDEARKQYAKLRKRR